MGRVVADMDPFDRVSSESSSGAGDRWMFERPRRRTTLEIFVDPLHVRSDPPKARPDASCTSFTGGGGASGGPSAMASRLVADRTDPVPNLIPSRKYR
eukprot:scaffold456_cov368-Pavlova_lutheri.AAC.29